MSTVFAQQLRASGGVIGAWLRPGGFAAWTGRDASRYTERVVPAAEVFGPGLDPDGLDAIALTMSSRPEGDRAGVLARALRSLARGYRHPDVDLAKLAVRRGWYDQAHLTNDLGRMLGETPGQYAARARG